MKEWIGCCDVHGLTQEGDTCERVLWWATRCCHKYVVMSRDSWESRQRNFAAMQEVGERQLKSFRSPQDDGKTTY